MAHIPSLRALKVTVLSGLMVGGLIISGSMFSSSAIAASTSVDKITRKEIAERLTAVGTVCLVGEPCATAVVMAVGSGEPRSGESVYGAYCTACHEVGVLNAPKRGDKATWDTRLASVGSYSQLLANSIKGIGAMPPKGTCMDCSDDEISAAIQYMSDLKP